MSADAHTAGGNFWQQSKEPRTVHPPVAGDLSVNVAIIGGGYTGLATAYHLKTADPSLDVAVLDAETAGFGASGRNAGFVMTLFGASSGLMKSLHGKDKLLAAHRYMESAIDALEAMVKEHKIDCDFERSGFLKVATSPTYEKRIKDEIELFHSIGAEGFEWLDAAQVAERVRSPTLLGAPLRPAQSGEVGRRAAPPRGCARGQAV